VHEKSAARRLQRRLFLPRKSVASGGLALGRHLLLGGLVSIFQPHLDTARHAVACFGVGVSDDAVALRLCVVHGSVAQDYSHVRVLREGERRQLVRHRVGERRIDGRRIGQRGPRLVVLAAQHWRRVVSKTRVAQRRLRR
jgi:hypothetical protein